ncbi:MAG: hypothetical protein FWG88_10280 [Oscillospiraceae bacterium]|nr:hypothetical protein [Oscillospiraceae bacterium]
MIESMERITEEYSGKWVLMIDCEEDENGTIINGRVILSDVDRNNIVSRFEEYEEYALSTSFRYIGKIPEGVSIL